MALYLMAGTRKSIAPTFPQTKSPPGAGQNRFFAIIHVNSFNL